ncbi:hypothetical protein CHS0354_039310 [Potamilus streckersoni]|uniref:Uncharacterized protein n=1 Tax=Potamilus streckersoni TaxID=2493646 RepID=A0AAE0SYZ7_9BIVA|nr:hypothetical protein CHS0354_039310 [Potamilus streckersoni]
MANSICSSRVVRVSSVSAETNNDVENDDVQELNQAGKYWTIVSNAKGEMSTAIETDAELQRETLLDVPNEVTKNSESDESIRSDDIYVSQEIVGYFNPITSGMIKFDDYIHPIHSNSLNTYFPTEVSDSQIYNMNMSLNREMKSVSI